MRGLALGCFALSAGTWLAPLAACGTSSAVCDCEDPALHVAVPEDLASSTMRPVLSGACAGETVSCSQSAGGGCAEYAFVAHKAGACHLDLDFATGRRFSADVKIAESAGCCAGFFAEPPSAGNIQVPEMDAGSD
ncbi:MAG: hypothetical protein ABIP39_13065 [Polyangiaceae bacterium]